MTAARAGGSGGSSPRASTVAARLTAAEAVRLIEAADGPADLFGDLASPDASRRFRRLARLTHPDARGHASAEAGDPGESPPRDSTADRAFARLGELWAQHQGARGPLLVRGDIANLYPVRGGLLKLPRDPADNDLMDREATALTQIHADGEERFGAYFPRLVQAQRVRDPRSGVERHGNVLARLAGFASLAQVRAAFPGGVDPRDAAWMWRRLLVAIGAAHRTGVIHGAVLPEHVLIHPAKHGLVLVDWCYSSRLAGSRAESSAALPAVVARYRDWYPPDVLARGPAGPDADIWMATRCVTELIGPRQPARMTAFAAGCMLANPSRRPLDAWRLLAELDELLERLYGPRAFRPFALP